MFQHLIRFCIIGCVIMMTAQGEDKIMGNNVKTYCVGRFLVDVPGEIKEINQTNQYVFNRIDSEVVNLTEEEFKTRMEKRQSELQTAKEGHEYAAQDMRSPNSKSRIMVTSKNLYGNIVYSYEVYKLDGNVLFSLKGDSEAKKFKEVLDNITTNFLPNLRYRAEDEIPTEAGFCIESGFIKGEGKEVLMEDAYMTLFPKAWPDVRVNISTERNDDRLNIPLFEREKGEGFAIPPGYAAFRRRVKTIRHNARDVNGMQGYEIAESLPMDEGFYTQTYVWDTIGKANLATAPHIQVMIASGDPQDGSGVPVRPAATEQALLSYFDTIVNSIRLRPTGPNKVSLDAPPRLPLGELARTGVPCPQTGLWKCAEGGEVAGGRVQRFAEGDLLPSARLVRDLSAWQKLIGERAYWDTETVWELVSYDEPATPTEPTDHAAS